MIYSQSPYESSEATVAHRVKKEITPVKKSGPLTPQKALEFMLQEKSEINKEYAELRHENTQLRDSLDSLTKPYHPLKHDPMRTRDSLELNKSELVAHLEYSKKPFDNNNLLQIPLSLWEGTVVWKIPFNGKSMPEKRLVAVKRATRSGLHATPACVVTNDGGIIIPLVYIALPPTVIWRNPENGKSNARELILEEGAHLLRGYATPAFRKVSKRKITLPSPDVCFSVVSSTRTLDVATETPALANELYAAFKVVLSLLDPSRESSDTENFENDEDSNDKIEIDSKIGEQISALTEDNSGKGDAASIISMRTPSSSNSHMPRSPSAPPLPPPAFSSPTSPSHLLAMIDAGASFTFTLGESKIF